MERPFVLVYVRDGLWTRERRQPLASHPNRLASPSKEGVGIGLEVRPDVRAFILHVSVVLQFCAQKNQ